MSIYPHPFDKRCLLAGPLGGDFGSHLWPGWQGAASVTIAKLVQITWLTFGFMAVIHIIIYYS